jgi:hypothetical protein
VGKLFVILSEEHRKNFENFVLRRTFGPRERNNRRLEKIWNIRLF